MDMIIKNIVLILGAKDWLIGDEDIDIAKGKYELQTTIKGYMKQRKRWK